MIIRQVVHVYCAAHQRIRKIFETGRREEFRNDTGTHLGNSFCSSSKMWQKEKTNHVDAHQFTIRCELNGNRRRKSSVKQMTKIPNRTRKCHIQKLLFQTISFGYIRYMHTISISKFCFILMNGFQFDAMACSGSLSTSHRDASCSLSLQMPACFVFIVFSIYR